MTIDKTLESIYEDYLEGNKISTEEIMMVLPKLKQTADTLLSLGNRFHYAWAPVNQMIYDFEKWLEKRVDYHLKVVQDWLGENHDTIAKCSRTEEVESIISEPLAVDKRIFMEGYLENLEDLHLIRNKRGYRRLKIFLAERYDLKDIEP